MCYNSLHLFNITSNFKLALNQCKLHEQEARATALARKFDGRNMKSFWNDIKSLNKSRPKLPTSVDGISGPSEICKLWKNKFGSILNSIHDESCANELDVRLQTMTDSPVLMTSVDEILSIAVGMASGKCPGKDNIPLEFYVHATTDILTWLCKFVNALMIHAYIPQAITEVVLSPLLKSSLKNPGLTENYRPIAHATSMSKIIENIILNRLEGFLETSDYQFGFKTCHGTDMGIFLLKDVVNYYRNLNTPIFLCFLDIKSCFDLISYNKLFCILCERGAPKYIVMLLLGWYMGQVLFVKWGNLLSDSFSMSNGIRQGSCLSPKLFSVYVDELNIMLKNSQVGCHVGGCVSIT